MPESTLRAFDHHGMVALTLERGLDEAQRLLERLAKAGIDYDDVVGTLETEGIRKFSDAFSELLAGLEAKGRALQKQRRPGDDVSSDGAAKRDRTPAGKRLPRQRLVAFLGEMLLICRFEEKVEERFRGWRSWPASWTPALAK